MSKGTPERAEGFYQDMTRRAVGALQILFARYTLTRGEQVAIAGNVFAGLALKSGWTPERLKEYAESAYKMLAEAERGG